MRLDGVAPQFSGIGIERVFHATEKTSARNAAGISGRKPACAKSWQKEPELPVVRPRAAAADRTARKKVGGIMARYYHYCALLRRSYRGKNRTALLLPAARGFQQIQPLSAAVWICCGSRKSNPPRNWGPASARLTTNWRCLLKNANTHNHKEVLTPDVRATGDWRNCLPG